MQRRRLRRSARHDERPQRLELAVAVVDCVLELGDAFVVHPCFLEMLTHLLSIGSGEERPDSKQVSLNRYEHFVDTRHLLDRACEADGGIELVDVTIGLDARMILGHASAAEQSGVP